MLDSFFWSACAPDAPHRLVETSGDRMECRNCGQSFVLYFRYPGETIDEYRTAHQKNQRTRFIKFRGQSYVAGMNGRLQNVGCPRCEGADIDNEPGVGCWMEDSYKWHKSIKTRAISVFGWSLVADPEPVFDAASVVTVAFNLDPDTEESSPVWDVMCAVFPDAILEQQTETHRHYSYTVCGTVRLIVKAVPWEEQ